jgi:hypothetical protein
MTVKYAAYTVIYSTRASLDLPQLAPSGGSTHVPLGHSVAAIV